MVLYKQHKQKNKFDKYKTVPYSPSHSPFKAPARMQGTHPSRPVHVVWDPFVAGRKPNKGGLVETKTVPTEPM